MQNTGQKEMSSINSTSHFEGKQILAAVYSLFVNSSTNDDATQKSNFSLFTPNDLTPVSGSTLTLEYEGSDGNGRLALQYSKDALTLEYDVKYTLMLGKV